MACIRTALTASFHPVINKVLAPIIPYITIGIGLLVLHNAWIAILSYHLGIVIVLLVENQKPSIKQLFQCRNYAITVAAMVLGAVGGILLYLLWPVLAIPGDLEIYLHNAGLNSITWPFFLAYFVLINPWLEEYYWRSYLNSPSKRLVLNDLWFSGYHILVLAGNIGATWLFPVFAVLLLGAWFWRQANRWNQGILASVVSHIAADLSVMTVIYFMIMRT